MNLFFRCCVPVGVGRGLADRNGYIVTRRHRGHLLVRCLSRYHARGGWHVRCQGCLARIRCGRRLQRRSRDDSVKYVMKHSRRTITQVPRSLPDPQIDLDLKGVLCTFFGTSHAICSFWSAQRSEKDRICACYDGDWRFAYHDDVKLVLTCLSNVMASMS